MFKSVKYHVSAGLIGYVEVKIWVQDDKIHYSKSSLKIGDENVKDAISPVSVETFSKKIESIRIPSWGKNYEPVGYIVLDGESWDVKYEDSDNCISKSSGSDAYPANWKRFLSILSEVAGNVGID